MDCKDWTQIQSFTGIHKISYIIIALLQVFHKLFSTEQCILLSFHFKTSCAYCTPKYPVPIACPLKHLLFSLLSFIRHIYLVEYWSGWIHWKHQEPWYIVPHMHQFLLLTISYSDDLGLEASSLENHYLVGFPLSTIIYLSFFVVLLCSSIIIASWDLLFSCGIKYLIEIVSEKVHL